MRWFKVLLMLLLAGIFLGGGSLRAGPYFLIDSYDEWQEAMGQHIRPLTPPEWTDYFQIWRMSGVEGQPYPDTTFTPAFLNVSRTGEPEISPPDAGLIMAWVPPQYGSYASAWVYDYGLDPDISNCTIKVTVNPRNWGPTGFINSVSFGIRDNNGKIRSWWWSCPAPIPQNVATTVTIDTSKVGIAATNPPATGFADNGCNLAIAKDFIVDENAQWIFGPLPVPPMGVQVPAAMWNYWHNLTVTPNTKPYKGNYVKYQQKPLEMANGMIYGWDEVSRYDQTIRPIMADDWICKDDRPVTDIHWWGSFKGWTQPNLPPVLPRAFHIGIWTDVPAGPNNQFSHPGQLVWENVCDSWVWNFAGYDKDPRSIEINEACFQFNQLLSQNEWFHQEPDPTGEGRIYWLSIAAIYDQTVTPQYPWGWKTRPHMFMDDAVRMFVFNPVWPVTVGTLWSQGQPVEFPAGTSWDLAFELTTNEPPAKALADLNFSGFVDLADLAIMAEQWLQAIP